MGSGIVRGLVTLALMVAFIAIVFWAYSKRRKAEFDEMAQLPFHEYPPGKEQSRKKETGKNQGSETP